MNFFLRAITYLLFTSLIICTNDKVTFAQTGHETALQFNKTVHNFGKISIKAGAQRCSFDFINKGSKPIIIHSVISSCGCTEPKWPQEPILPGKEGKIEVTFLNDQGPYPFDKTLTIYTSESKRPILLRITGIVYEKEKSLKEMFPVTMGLLGVMRQNAGVGQIEQGLYKTGGISVANLSSKDVTLTFADVDKGLSIKAEPQVIKAGEVGEVSFSIETEKALHWGNTTYKAFFVCNGIKAATPLKIEALIIDRVTGLTKEEKSKSSMILAKNSSVELGNVKRGETVEALFELRNTGAGPLILHKVENNGKEFKIQAPKSVNPGEPFTVKATIETAKFTGEEVFTITLITNSPLRPLVNLFVSAVIE